MAASLFDAARDCLAAASPEGKVAATHAAAAAFRRGELVIGADGEACAGGGSGAAASGP